METAMSERIEDLKFFAAMGLVTIFGTFLTALVG